MSSTKRRKRRSARFGREEKAAAADKVSPIVRHRASMAQLKVLGLVRSGRVLHNCVDMNGRAMNEGEGGRLCLVYKRQICPAKHDSLASVFGEQAAAHIIEQSALLCANLSRERDADVSVVHVVQVRTVRRNDFDQG
jgi:hypothetical protein